MLSGVSHSTALITFATLQGLASRALHYYLSFSATRKVMLHVFRCINVSSSMKVFALHSS